MTTYDLEAALIVRLIERKGEWKKIAQGTGVSYSWITQFANRKLNNPGYRTLKRLDAYLSLNSPASKV